ncbi:putative methyl-accepting chemotaxis protein [Geobacter sp. OR-1]|uniref:methyl-accepting chemotaxis protein n=1 Tax=Geobacter sp. OR-1 TaxID=1266765 RepID=UPI00054238C6|nr:methyl-accepting chemotaxis protein [Geobacter sp. OR-1]GAM11810.1 putative methyl-accepting chemotaxis protein [Geobacter sp. OR-1]
MYIPLGYKFILGCIVVVAAVAFVPDLIRKLGYAPEITTVLSYVVAITIGLILGWLFSRRASRNMGLLTSSTEAISSGDLTSDVELRQSRFPDETQCLAESINIMAENLRALVRQIRDISRRVFEESKTLSSTAIEINASTEEVAQAIEQISRGAETQAEMVTKSSKVIHEMAISVDLVAKRAREAAKAARDTSVTAKRGGELANDSLERMKEFYGSVELTGQLYLELNKRLQHIGKIADIILDISRQTNLLALNASIEAARAGEYGKGFAVVADEVRKLADGTGTSATEIVDLIASIKEDGQKVSETITESFRSIAAGKKNIDITAAAFGEILTTVSETERRANSIADLSQMQNEGAGKMVEMVDEIARVAEDNAASTEEVSAATEEQSSAMQEMADAAKELAGMAEEMLRCVEKFRVGEQDGK